MHRKMLVAFGRGLHSSFGRCVALEGLFFPIPRLVPRRCRVCSNVVEQPFEPKTHVCVSRTCITGMSITVFMPLIPRIVVSVIARSSGSVPIERPYSFYRM